MNTLMISRLKLSQEALRGETVLITGAGGGIGYEAARALLWLGANIIIAEINTNTGSKAAETLGIEFETERVCFIQSDVGDEDSVINLHKEALRRFGKVDAVLNNATIAVLGTVVELPIDKWDFSYRVNLRGPVLLARAFLPDMIKRQHGTFVCVSSTGTAYLGGYETFKAAQVHLSNTLDAELEGTGVYAYTIGPGLVQTETALKAIEQLAPLMGLSVGEFLNINNKFILSPEEAGVGFALSILYAERFKGMEISSIQAIKAADISFGSSEAASTKINPKKRKQAKDLCACVRRTLQEQYDGWKQRSLFERQWVIRDFRKTAGMSAEEWLGELDRLETSLQSDGEILCPPLEKLTGYYNHLAELAKGYEKNAEKLQENLKHVYRWRDEADILAKLLEK